MKNIILILIVVLVFLKIRKDRKNREPFSPAPPQKPVFSQPEVLLNNNLTTAEPVDTGAYIGSGQTGGQTYTPPGSSQNMSIMV